ncbi:hypothetical protein DUNSADRAFT_2147 [Dunaliella salina]|uniref:Encoded protein n=1 Tax=Dunaliella salina TaxID=3046 RepID=A0ABQ7H8I0_DUNSA|nr:hypothetical protein DUNSADRAFT_2147 [Dunaliella salina]|eukprot:KAF5843110.1 hypothetical protein DUNSADRAFT_2147 [Dunaliella salina]
MACPQAHLSHCHPAHHPSTLPPTSLTPLLPPSPSLPQPEPEPEGQEQQQQEQQQEQQQQPAVLASREACIWEVEQNLKSLRAAAYEGDAHAVLAETQRSLQAVKPTLPSSHFAQKHFTATVLPASKRMCKQSMGACKPLQKRYAAANRKPVKKLWDGAAKAPGRKKGASKRAIPRLPKQKAGRMIGSAVMRGIVNV